MNVPRMIAVSALGVIAGVPLITGAIAPAASAGPPLPHHAVASHVVADDDFGPGGGMGGMGGAGGM